MATYSKPPRILPSAKTGEYSRKQVRTAIKTVIDSKRIEPTTRRTGTSVPSKTSRVTRVFKKPTSSKHRIKHIRIKAG